MSGLIYKLSEIKDENKQNIIYKLKDYTEAEGFEVKEGQIAAWEACL